MKKINFKTSFFLVVLLTNFGFYSCATEQQSFGPNKGIKGRFVNHTFLEKVSNSIPGEIPFYCSEMNFFSEDSVHISNGFEDYKLAYKNKGDHYVLVKASFKGDMPFRLNKDNSITLIDTAWTHISTNSEFIEVKDKEAKDWVFDHYLNEKIIAGEYNLYKKGKNKKQKVTFKANGNVKGLQDYVHYSICYSGDCVGTSNPRANIISFENKNGKITDYAFSFENQTINLYTLAKPITDIKGQRPIKDKLFELKK